MNNKNMSKKNQWRLRDACFGRFKSFNIKAKRLAGFRFANLFKGGLTVLISVLIIYGVVQASTIKITPPTGAPTATFYSLTEIYNFITANTTATVGSPALDWSGSLADSGKTLTEIYSALAQLISAGSVKYGTTYLGVTGAMSLFPTLPRALSA